MELEPDERKGAGRNMLLRKLRRRFGVFYFQNELKEELFINEKIEILLRAL